MKKSGNSYLLALAVFSFTYMATHNTSHADVAGAFSKGNKHFAIYGGTGYAFNDEYFVIGAKGSYYFANGFNVGLGLETWTGGNPDISKITPSLQYVFYQPAAVKPYVGVFYRRTYIENLEDLESTGVRAGVFIASGRNVYIGLGGVYESYLDCEESIYQTCDESYPEISITFAF